MCSFPWYLTNIITNHIRYPAMKIYAFKQRTIINMRNFCLLIFISILKILFFSYFHSYYLVIFAFRNKNQLEIWRNKQNKYQFVKCMSILSKLLFIILYKFIGRLNNKSTKLIEKFIFFIFVHFFYFALSKFNVLSIKILGHIAWNTLYRRTISETQIITQNWFTICFKYVFNSKSEKIKYVFCYVLITDLYVPYKLRLLKIKMYNFFIPKIF